MRPFLGLVNRNIKNFYRSKTNLFFATLSVLILVGLHFIIFQDMYSADYVNILGLMGNTVSKTDAKFLADNVMLASIFPISGITISLVTLGLIVSDKQSKAFNSFLVSPINRTSVLFAYVISSLVVGFVILTGMLVFFQIYFLIAYGIGFTIVQMLLATAANLVILIFSNLFMLIVISFIKHEQTLGALGAIFGTIIGFISGAYMPISMFGDSMASVFNMLPFSQGTIVFRQIFVDGIWNKTNLPNNLLTSEFASGFGLNCEIFGTVLPTGYIILIYSVITIALAGLAILRFKKIRND